MFLQQAFDSVLNSSKKPEQWFVALIESAQLYGGPEEGGWWYTANQVVAYQEFPEESKAEEAKKKIETLAEELKQQAQKAHGESMLASLDWLEARGLEPDFLPEPDGPTNYWIYVGNEFPEFSNHKPHYE